MGNFSLASSSSCYLSSFHFRASKSNNFWVRRVSGWLVPQSCGHGSGLSQKRWAWCKIRDVRDALWCHLLMTLSTPGSSNQVNIFQHFNLSAPIPRAVRLLLSTTSTSPTCPGGLPKNMEHILEKDQHSKSAFTKGTTCCMQSL